MRQLGLVILSFLVVVQQGVVARNDARTGLDAFRGGSAVRSPPPKTLQDKNKKKPSLERGGKQAPVNQSAKNKAPQTTTTGTKFRLPLSEHKDALLGVLILTAVERAISKVFQANSIKFPAQLAGCIALFFFLLLADGVHPGLGESMYSSLLPGSTLLAKWFPVLFVPGLVMLPLAPSIGNGVEVVKFISVVVVGFVYSMVTTAYTVQFLRSAQGKLAPPPPPPRAPRKKASVVSKPAVPTAVAKAYRDETMSFLFKAAVVSGMVSILATNAGNEFAMPIRTVFFFFTTFASFVWGARLPASFTKVVHPLILSTIITLSVILGTSVATADNFITVLKTYKTGTYDILKMGAADIMLFLLGPSVVSFAISMYNRRFLLRDNLLIVIVSMIVSSVGGLFGTAAYVRFLQLGGKVGGGMIRLSTLSRNVTTALAIACTNVLKGDVSLAVLIVVLTGVLGATYGRTMLDSLKIYDPVTRGLAVGGAAQGLGVTSMMPEADAYPFAAMSMILTAISATVLVSIPSVNHALVTLAQGNL